jgi:hypothetical protein
VTAAAAEYLWTKADGSTQLIRIRIGIPFKGKFSWECEVHIEGLLQNIGNTRGESSLQALSLAIVFVESALVSIIERGELLSYPDRPQDALPRVILSYH